MKVCLISKSDVKGGAAKVAFELARGLRARGHDCTMLVQSKSSSEDWVEELPSPADKQGKLSQRVIHRIGLNSLSLNSPFPKDMGGGFFRQFDVIHLHDLPAHFNFLHLPWLTSICPTFWTLHTMNAFTGGCLYAYNCQRHLKWCGGCPQFGKFPLQWLHRDGSREVLALRKLIYSRSRLHPICVSRWLANEARKSVLARFDIHTILNPVDQDAFYPVPKAEARERLGIPADKRVILFSVSANLRDMRKGTDIIFDAVKALRGEPLFFIPLTIATESEELAEALQGTDGLPPRHLSTNAELRLHYSAADVVWHPTRADTSSMVSLEALSCGTPVIAAAVGGVPEIVRDGENGLLIEPDFPEAIVEATRRLLADPRLGEGLAINSRSSIHHDHSTGVFVENHLELFQDIIN